ncbi:MAG: hypothetical protein IKY71_04740, partial [Bacteroidaceae bacterium]|nr:hypothetical protein [Bacteroidaceae bacterium]
NIGVDPKVVCHFSGKPSTTRLNVVNRRSTPEGAKVNESIKSKEQFPNTNQSSPTFQGGVPTGRGG